MTRSTRYVVTGVAVAAAGVLGWLFLQPLALALAPVGVVIAFLGLTEARARRRNGTRTSSSPSPMAWRPSSRRPLRSSPGH